MKYQSEISAPSNASGTVNKIIKGSRKLSNCAASIKYINPSASINAKIKLDELSLKSFEVPSSAVANLSSRTLSATLCIASIPSPKETPGANPAETVAET